MKTIKAKDLKIGDKIFDIPPGDIDRLQFEVIGMDENDIHLKPLSDDLHGYIFDKDKDYMSFPIGMDDWYLV